MAIVQDSIVKAMSSQHSLIEPDYIKTWFYRIVVNTSLDYLRRQKKVIVSEEEILTSGTGKPDQYEDIDLHKAMDNLPDNYRSIIVLRYFEDLKIEEVADVLGQNVNTIKTRLYKALEKLRIQMND